MSTRFNMFDEQVEEVMPRPMKNGTIEVYRDELHHRILKCHRIEDAIWYELTGLGCDEHSKALQVDEALMQIHCPPWCELAAWERIAESFRTWSTVFGNLTLFWSLRRKRDE